MKITSPLDKIMNNETKVKILRFLSKSSAEWTGRQIAKEVGVTPATAHKALHGLHDEEILLLKQIGKNYIYSLNKENFIVQDMLKPLFAKEDRILKNIMAVITRKISFFLAKKNIVSVALFGSVNVRKDCSGSDIDLAVIVKYAKVKKNVENLFWDISQAVAKEFGNTVSPYVNTTREFRSKHKKGLAVIKNIMKSHTVIYGERLERLL